MKTYPGSSEANELQELCNPWWQKRHDQIKRPHSELYSTLKMRLELVIFLGPISVLQNLPASSKTQKYILFLTIMYGPYEIEV